MGPCPEGVVEGEGEEGNVTTIRGRERSYMIEGLRVNAEYSGTILAVNDRGSSNITSFAFTTPTAGDDLAALTVL